MKTGVFHVILAGGSGTRFWPVSRTGRPKQFQALAGDAPLVRQAYDRAAAMSSDRQVYVAAGAAQRQMILDALPGLDPGRFIAEPCPRNTAPSVGLAALRLSRLDAGGIMIVSPADHVYGDPAALLAALETAVFAAREEGDALVTLGIRPSRPEVGYGYIELQDDAAQTAGARRAVRFVEKPDAPTARSYLADGRHLWNSGVFIWRTRAILRALERWAPDLWASLRKIDAALGGPDEERVVREAFDAMPSISIDYAVMEKATPVLVVPVDPGWSDVGSWDAVAELHDTDASGNGAVTSGEVLSIGSTNTFVYSTTRRLIATVGAQDLLVVDAGDALLICRRGESQSVRALVEALKARGRGDLL